MLKQSKNTIAMWIAIPLAICLLSVAVVLDHSKKEKLFNSEITVAPDSSDLNKSKKESDDAAYAYFLKLGNYQKCMINSWKGLGGVYEDMELNQETATKIGEGLDILREVHKKSPTMNDLLNREKDLLTYLIYERGASAEIILNTVFMFQCGEDFYEPEQSK